PLLRLGRDHLARGAARTGRLGPALRPHQPRPRQRPVGARSPPPKTPTGQEETPHPPLRPGSPGTGRRQGPRLRVRRAVPAPPPHARLRQAPSHTPRLPREAGRAETPVLERREGGAALLRPARSAGVPRFARPARRLPRRQGDPPPRRFR